MQVRKLTAGCLAAAIILVAASAAHAAVWTCDFSNWTGSNFDSSAAYTDTAGQNPRSFDVGWTGGDIWGLHFSGNPWLYQGGTPGNETARFDNPSYGAGARFQGYTPDIPLSTGISVAWSMRFGSLPITRGPIQIAGTIDGTPDTTKYTAYINLGTATENSTVRIQDNAGGVYNTIGTLSLGQNLANSFRQWNAAVIYNPDDDMAYWKLWLDGNLLQFTGDDGSPTIGGEQYSFRTIPEGFTGNPYIGLGDIGPWNPWDIEFEYVNYRNDGYMSHWVPEPATMVLLALGAGLIRRRRVHV